MSNTIELSDELGGGLDLRGSQRSALGTGNAVGEAESGGNITVGGTVAEAAASITVALGDVGTGTLAGGESTATLLALGVVGASLRDEVGAELAGLDGDGEDLELNGSEGKSNSSVELHDSRDGG